MELQALNPVSPTLMKKHMTRTLLAATVMVLLGLTPVATATPTTSATVAGTPAAAAVATVTTAVTLLVQMIMMAKQILAGM